MAKRLIDGVPVLSTVAHLGEAAGERIAKAGCTVAEAGYTFAEMSYKLGYDHVGPWIEKKVFKPLQRLRRNRQ